MKFEIISMMPTNNSNHGLNPLLSNEFINSFVDNESLNQKVLDCSVLTKNDFAFLNKLCDVIDDNYHDAFFLKPQLASKMFISERHLQRKVKTLTDENPMDLLRIYRLKKAFNKIKRGQQVSATGFECGFNSSSYFGSCFKKMFGVSPKKYQTLNSVN